MFSLMMKFIIWKTKHLGGLSSIGVNFDQFKWKGMLEKHVRPPSN